MSQPAAHAKHPRIDQFIRQRIVEGKWTPGRQIPTYDELEDQFGVSRATVMQAITRLKHDGFLISGGQRGVFVAEHLPHACNLGLVYMSSPDDPHHWTRFCQALDEQMQAAMSARPGRMLRYHQVRPRDDSEDYLALTADLKAHRLGRLLFVQTGKDMVDTPVMQLPNVARVVLTDRADIPEAAMLYPDLDAFRQRAMAYLASRGRQRVALLVGGDDHPGGDVLNDWAQAMTEHGLQSDPRWQHHVTFHPSGWARHLVHLLFDRDTPNRPDALIVTDDHFAADATQGLRDAGVQVGEDLDVVVQCNYPRLPACSTPVTWLGFDTSALVHKALEMLDALQQDRPLPTVTKIPALFSQELSK